MRSFRPQEPSDQQSARERGGQGSLRQRESGHARHAEVLALQRTAGNQAVGRLIGSSALPLRRAGAALLQRGPVDRLDPGADDFWDDLLNETEKNLIAWLNAHHFQAIEQFSDDMTTGGGADAGQIAANSFIGLVSAIPTYGNLAAGLMNMVKLIYEGLTADDPIALSAFLKKLRDNGAALSDRISAHDPQEEFFRLVEEARADEATSDWDNSPYRRQVAGQIDSLLSALPRKDRIEATFALDWVNSSRDSWDIDMGGTKAGYVFVRATYEDSIDAPGSWRLDHAPYIDDASNAEGVTAALTSAFGKDTPLELLPLQMVVSAYVEKPTAPGEPRVIDRRWGAEIVNPGTAAAAQRSNPAWQLRDGDESFLLEWRRARPLPTVKDLAAEGLWN